MANRTRPYGDPEGEDVPVRDRPYESFGQQGYAMPDHLAAPDAERGAARVELGRPVLATDDDRIRDEIVRLLAKSAAVDASRVDIVVTDGDVTLTGTAPDEDQRARIEAIVESVAAAAGIENQIVVEGR